MKKLILLLPLLFSLFISQISYAHVMDVDELDSNELDFNQSDIKNTVDSIWTNYYAKNLNPDGSIRADLANKLSWRGSIATMMFVHAYEIFKDDKYLQYAEASYTIAHQQWSDDLAWAANSALEIFRHLQNSPTSYQSLRPKEYYIKDISNIYLSLISPLGSSVTGQTKNYDTFKISYIPSSIHDSHTDTKKIYSAIMWSTNPEWGLSDPQFNTCSLGQSIVLSYQMSQTHAFDTQKPKIHAREWLETQLDHLINYDLGIIYDHVKISKDENNPSYFFYRSLDTREFTYNIGTVLAALGLQDDFDAHQTPTLLSFDRLKLYQNILTRIQDKFTKNSILNEFNSDPEFYPGNTYGGDHSAFKAVFMHFLPYFYFSRTMQNNKNVQNEFKTLVNTSANAAWKQLKEHNSTASYDWTSFNPSQTNCITTISAVESLITAWQLQTHSQKLDTLNGV